jgi:RNA 2',3'-cyclic 3'-phosphodiesterase
MRLFVGIPLAEAVVEELSKVSLRFRAKDDGLRWSAPESWHITLQFLGNTGDDQYACVAARLGELRFQPVPIRIEELGFFDRAGVFFAGVDLSPELIALQQRVAVATSQCGFVHESRPYHPHITLARTKGRSGKHALRTLQARFQHQPQFGRFVAQEFVLYESVTHPEGSQYTIRERFPLQ